MPTVLRSSFKRNKKWVTWHFVEVMKISASGESRTQSLIMKHSHSQICIVCIVAVPAQLVKTCFIFQRGMRTESSSSSKYAWSCFSVTLPSPITGTSISWLTWVLSRKHSLTYQWLGQINKLWQEWSHGHGIAEPYSVNCGQLCQLSKEQFRRK